MQGNLRSQILQNPIYSTLLLHKIIEQNAHKYPQRNAVAFADQYLTYGELNQQANKLAQGLINQGIKQESRVAVCLRPGLEIIITLLAIQKAGAVYLPIDPDYPPQRIQTIIRDAEVSLTISQEDVIEYLQDVLVCPYTLPQLLAGSTGNDNPRVAIDPDQTAYIFYTSGTTGVPKGIAISYQSFVYYIVAAIRQFDFNPQDTTLTIAKYSFSISLFELMTSLVAGGQLKILSRAEIMDYGYLAAALTKATVVHIGPNLLRGLVQYIDKNYPSPQAFAKLRHVSSGGDIVPPELLEQLKQVFPQAEIYVIYGCTEIACMGCCYLAPRETIVDKAYIGQPFLGTTAVLLKENGNIAAINEVGEICFKGLGIMQGYLNQAKLTSQALVEIDHDTYFRTGDLARQHPSGNLEYLGRRDFQIKLRGQRIELIEVESHLRQAPGVKDAVVAVHKLGNQDKRLIAYLTLEDREYFSLDAVRVHLQKCLPDYMQPSGWIVLETLPLNDNLKIARQALPLPTQDNLIVTETYAPPQNSIEQMLCLIWQDVLDLPQVGVKDNFFHIGGDSLTAMNICMLAAEEGIELSPLQISSTPTIAELLELGVGRYQQTSHPDPDSSGDLTSLPPFILRFLYERGCQTPHHWNISRILIAQKHLDWGLVKHTFSYLGERHDALRLKLEPEGDRWQASIVATTQETLVCKQVNLAELDPASQNAAIAKVAQACQRTINLSRGPIAYLVLFDLGVERPQELFFVVHHFAMDVVSWKIFWLEFEMIYQQLATQGKATLSTFPTSFRTWTQTLKQYANSATVEQDIKQWLQQPWSQVFPLPKELGAKEAKDLRSLNNNGSARAIGGSLSEWQTELLMRNVTQELDLEQILISSLAATLSQWQASNLVYFDRLVHGRNVGMSEFDLSRTVGCILSYAPTLININPQATAEQILLGVAQQMKRAGDSGTSIDLYRYFGSQPGLVKKLTQLPQAEVLLNYRGKVDDVLERSKIFDQTRAISSLDHNPDGLRQYPIAIVVDIIERKLEVRWVYSQNIHQQSTIADLNSKFLNYVVEMQNQVRKHTHLKIVNRQ